MSSIFSTASLDALQNVGQRKVLDIVDQLRRSGLSSILKLPQIIVCGNQSSGKSSVLEAISEIPLPRKENLCTRFATEIILKRADVSTITVTITPDKNKPKSEQENIRAFRKTEKTLSRFASIVEEATTLMGLDDIDGPDKVNSAATKAFTRDVLRLEICGPDRPQLTLVDLPGIIQTDSKAATEADVALIKDLVRSYMANERTIILAVVSAKDDFNNQPVLRHCRDFDPSGSRTLGIITKPDELREGSNNQKSWISLANNQEIYFKLGWHILKNRSEEMMNSTFQERNAAEKAFFSAGVYGSLAQSMLGIETLRTRLSNLLHDHLKKELPSLRKELLEELSKTRDELARFGVKRTSAIELRQFLTTMSMGFYEIMDSAIKGQYEQPFFGPVDTESPVDAESNITRFRAIVQFLNLDFAKSMRLRGHKYQIGTKEGEPDDFDNGATEGFGDLHYEIEDESYGFEPNQVERCEDGESGNVDETHIEPQQPEQITRTEAEDWVVQILQRCRGRELPGNFNPMLIGQLFWEQSEPWKQLAEAHVIAISDRCRQFVRRALEHVAPEDVRDRIWEFKVEPALNNALAAGTEELGKILNDKKCHPSAYNHYYTTTIQKNRHKNLEKVVSSVTTAATMKVQEFQYISPVKVRSEMDKAIIKDMDRFSAQEVLDSQQAYYKVSRVLVSLSQSD